MVLVNLGILQLCDWMLASEKENRAHKLFFFSLEDVHETDVNTIITRASNTMQMLDRCDSQVLAILGSFLSLLQNRWFFLPPVCFPIHNTSSKTYFYYYYWGGVGVWGYGPFKNISLIVEPIAHQSWAETGEPGEKPSVSSLAFPHVTRAGLKPQRWET